MSYKNVDAHALGHLRAATCSTNSCLGPFCGRVTLMSCIVNDNHSKKKSYHIGT